MTKPAARGTRPRRRPSLGGTALVLVAALVAGCGKEAAGPGAAGDQALIEAAAAGDSGAVKRLLDQGASVDATDAAGRTALIAAAYGNHVDVAEALIEAGADVDVQDATQQSA